jgi:hypothetical protein
MILSFYCARDFAQGLGGGCGEPQDANSLEDATKLEAKHALGEQMRLWRERKRDRYAAGQEAKR